MINKKLIFSLMTMPAAIWCYDNSEWQKRRAAEKLNEIKRRRERLTGEAIDITPKDGKFCFSGMTPAEIEDEYGFKRVKVKGVIDLDRETMVKTVHRGEPGFYIINPIYTHVNEDKEPCGILINRGFLSEDYYDSREQHRIHKDGWYEGVLYCGENPTKYDELPNVPATEYWTKVRPKDLSLDALLKNREDSGVAMLMAVEFDEDLQKVMPSAPTVNDLVSWKNKPARHTAYQYFWKYATYLNVFANSMFWLYF